MAGKLNWLSDMLGKNQTEQIQAMKDRAGWIMRKSSVSSARIVVTTDVEGIKNYYNVGLVYTLANSTDGRIRKMEKILNNFIKERKYSSKLKDRKKTKETPSIDSRKRDRFLCLVVSDLVDLETCKRKAPAENPNDYNAGKRKKGLDGNYWIVAKTWIQDNN
jgi:hypothetical protein